MASFLISQKTGAVGFCAAIFSKTCNPQAFEKDFRFNPSRKSVEIGTAVYNWVTGKDCNASWMATRKSGIVERFFIK